MKKVIGKVRLCPNTPAWSNVENNIFLSKARRKEANVFEGCDMDVIMKAVNAGLIEFKEDAQRVKQEEKQQVKQEVKAAKQEAKQEAKEVKQEVKEEKKENKSKKVDDIVQNAKKKAAAKAKKEEVAAPVEEEKKDEPVGSDK